MNLRVAVANRLFRDLSLDGRLRVVSSDNIRVSDLSDAVHLNAVGAAGLFNDFILHLHSLAF